MKTQTRSIDITATNGAANAIAVTEPYIVRLMLQGTSPILFHRWNDEAVAEKAAAKKNSASKKSDDVESYVYRNADEHICIPGTYLLGAIVTAAKFRQDPRSPRKSAMDLYKASVLSLTDLAPICTGGQPCREWESLDRRRVTVQRAGITRSRPRFEAGWTAEFELLVQCPEYVSPLDLRETIDSAGKLIGIADFRPSHGRFVVTAWKEVQ